MKPSLILWFLLFMPGVLLAQEVKVLEPIQGITGSGSSLTLASLLQNLFSALLGIGAMLAVVMLVYGGIQYMTSDQVFSKEDARARIKNAVLGLLLLFGSVLILEQINPDLLKFNLNLRPAGVPELVQPAENKGPLPTSIPRTQPKTDPNLQQVGPDGKPVDQPGNSAAPAPAA